MLCAGLPLLAASAHGQTVPPPQTATLRGVVLDRADGAPIADVSVQLQDSRQSATTDARGRFELRDVQPGSRTVYVSIVGFILVKRQIAITAGQTAELTITLTEGTGTYTEDVTVLAERFREHERAVVAQQVLGSADVQNLRSLVTNDPMRAVQALPGVTTGDDFRSEFAVRGSPFSRLVFTIDGIPSSFLLHTVQQVFDGGSIAMLNGDILDGISLLNGSYPQRYGNRLGAELDFHIREGSRDRRQLRLGVSGTDTSVVVEGPLGRSRAGSWLFSARKSYLEYILRKIAPEDNFGFGFTDVQGKIVRDVSDRHRLEASFIAGRSRYAQTLEFEIPDEVTDGRNASQAVNLAWRFTPSERVVITQRAGLAFNQFENINLRGARLGDGDGRDLTWRADVTAVRSTRTSIEAGGQVQWLQRRSDLVDLSGAPFALAGGRTRHSGAYGQLVWSPSARLTLIPGARVDHWSLTADTAASPWIQAAYKLSSSVTLRGGAGIYRQFPGIDVATGVFGNPAVGPERAIHVDAGVEQVIGNSRWQVTLYTREERDVLRQSGAEFRIVDDELLFPGSLLAPWANSVRGHARGVELLAQRKSTAGVSGWLSYSYGVNRYVDDATGERFDGDLDQRHTVNAYLVMRLSNRASFAMKLRAGSNVPAVGYWEARDDRFFVGTTRNSLRVPVYSRLDVRFNRAFDLRGKRLTLFAEVLNLLGRDNVRAEVAGLVNPFTREVFELFQPMIPRVPSAGLLLEF